MKALVVYSSRTGNTRKIAEAIAAVRPGCEIHPVESAPAPEGYDLVAVGYWVDKGMPDAQAKAYLETVRDANVALFGTLGAWPDSDHARDCIAQGDAHLVVERIVEYAAPQVGALPAGDTSPHGFVPQLDDLRPYAFRFERPGHFGQGDEGIARMPRTSVYQQYFHGQLSLLIRRSSTARAALPGATPSDRPPKAPRS